MLDPEYRCLFLEKVEKYGNHGWQEVFNRVVSQALLRVRRMCY